LATELACPFLPRLGPTYMTGGVIDYLRELASVARVGPTCTGWSKKRHVTTGRPKR